MATSWILLAILGLSSLLTTATIFFLEIANAVTLRSTPSVHIAAAVAAALEGLVLATVLLLVFMSLRHSTYYGPNRLGVAWFPFCLVTVFFSTAASIVVLVLLSRETENATILGASEGRYLAGTGVVLGLASTMQLIFIIVYFIGSGVRVNDEERSYPAKASRSMTQMRVKSVPYSRTAVDPSERKENNSMDLQSPPGSRASVAETFSSFRTSFSHSVRPMTSRTRLVSRQSNRSIRSTYSRTPRRPASIETFPDMEPGFDSWDTTSVDPQNRLAVDTSNIPRFLETIPASPTVSRSPSPGYALDFDLPKRAKRSRARSYSPVPMPAASLHPCASTGELHIHPLFRADSPSPAPAATPGTSIVAAPDAHRTVSVKELHRMRSGSLPASCRSRSSFESMKSKSPSPNAGRLSPIPADAMEERQMTPPLPDWVLNAGTRKSLTEYHFRKLRDTEDMRDSGLGISQ